jgi:hypothetical protein
MKQQRSPFIIVPYSDESTLNPALRVALEMERLDAVFIRTGGFKDDYWNFFEHWWQTGSSFILLEQDNVPFPGALQAMWDCPEGWCVHEYLIQTKYTWALGCTKFSAPFINQFPDLMKEALSGHIWADYESRAWWELDVRVNQTLLRLYGQEPHIHQPPVLHLNPKHLEG